MNEIVEIIVANKYRAHEIAVNVDNDLKLIDEYLRKKYSLTRNIINEINVERFMGVFAQWLGACNYLNTFKEKYWILKISNKNHQYYYKIIGFNEIDRFLKSGKIDFDPKFNLNELDVKIFFKPEININALSEEAVDSFLLGVATSHLKFMNFIVLESLAQGGDFWQNCNFQIGLTYNKSLKLLFDISPKA